MPRIITDQTPQKVVDEQQVKLFGSPKERLDFYRREIHYETTNLSNRTNAYLSAQSFLVIAYASSMANMNTEWGAMFTLVVPPMLALLGLLSTLFAWPAFGRHATSFSTGITNSLSCCSVNLSSG